MSDDKQKVPPKQGKHNTVSSEISSDHVLKEGARRNRPPAGQYTGQTAPTARPKRHDKGFSFTASEFDANSTTVENLQSVDSQRDQRRYSTLNESQGYSPEGPPKPLYKREDLLEPPVEPDHVSKPARKMSTEGGDTTRQSEGDKTFESIFGNLTLDQAAEAKLLYDKAEENKQKIADALEKLKTIAGQDELLVSLQPPVKFKDEIPIEYVTVRGKGYKKDYNSLLSQRAYVVQDAQHKTTLMNALRVDKKYAEHDNETLQHMCKDAEAYLNRLENLDSRILSTLEPVDHPTYVTWTNYDKLPLEKEILACEGLLYQNGKPISDVLGVSLFGNINSSKEKDGTVTTKAMGPHSSTIVREGATVTGATPKISEKDLEIIRWNGTKEDFWRFKDSADDLFGKYEVDKISWIRKFNYLKQCLNKDEQKRMLQYYPDEDGWFTYWRDSINLYGDTQSQVFLWTAKLRKLPYVVQGKNGNIDTKSLNAHYEEVKIVIRNLNRFGKTGADNWQEYLPYLNGKLDMNTSMEWNLLLKEEEVNKNKPDYDPIKIYQNFLKKKIDLINKVKNDYFAVKPFHRESSHKKPSKPKPKREQASYNETFVTTAAPRKPSVRKKTQKRTSAPRRPSIKIKAKPVKKSIKKVATFENKEPRNCFIHPDQSHKPWDCPNMGDGKTLWSKMYSYPEKVCQGCLHNGHYLSKCKKVKVCGIQGCTHKHHRKLHFAQPHYVSFRKWNLNKKNGSNKNKK